MQHFSLRSKPGSIQLLVFLMGWFCCLVLYSILFPLITERLNVKNIAELPSSVMLFITILTQILTFLLPVFIFVKLLKVNAAAYLGIKTVTAKNLVWISLLSIGVVLLLMSSGGLLKLADLGVTADKMQEHRDQTEAMLYQMKDLPSLLTNIIAAALLPAICEELFFRGIIQRFVFIFTRKMWIAIGISALIFSFFHASVYNFLPIFLAGIVLGSVYFFTGNIRYNILLHFLNNAIQLVLIYYTGMDESGNLNHSQVVLTIGLLIASVVLIYFILKKLKNNHQTLPKNWNMVIDNDLKSLDI